MRKNSIAVEWSGLQYSTVQWRMKNIIVELCGVQWRKNNIVVDGYGGGWNGERMVMLRTL